MADRPARSPIVIDVDDRPIPVQIGSGDPFLFVGVLSSKQLALTLGPLQDKAKALDASDPAAVGELTDDLMATLADLLVDDDQRERWLALDLDVATLLAVDRPSVLGSLVEEWTGRPLDSA